MPWGVINQLGTSLGSYGVAIPEWVNVQGQDEVINEINGFRAFYHYGALTGYGAANYMRYVGVDDTLLAIQVPYTPSATMYQYTDWQVNDPLVHYLASDLNTSIGNGVFTSSQLPGNLGVLNQRYMPWGGYPNTTTGQTTSDFNTANATNLKLKDPLIYSSDDWNFPTNLFPTVGWLGRVHRGTPWQTVYLKSSGIDTGTWTNWTGDNNAYDAANSTPIQDWLLFDLFTTAPNDNATRGQLSVNVGSAPGGHDLAAWSAVFSGIAVPLYNTNGIYTSTVIQPAGVYDPTTPPPLVEIVTNLNAIRAGFVNTDGTGGVFEHVGDILAAPTLTVQSPFLDLSQTNNNRDELYEWLPQQIMSLLTVSDSPRYVVYCYGQTLKPAPPPNGVYLGSGSFFNMVTNYQVVSETAVRAVIRVDDATTTHPHVVVESYNVLPPD